MLSYAVHTPLPLNPPVIRPRENMVGVNMVLAECNQNTLK